MELSKELKTALVNGFDDVKSVDVKYESGEFVSGFIKEVNFGTSLNVTICKHRSPREESPLHDLDIDRALKISLLYHRGEIKVFE